MTVQMDKKYVTRTLSRAVRIYCVDGGGEYPVHGARWCNFSDKWITNEWALNGTHSWDPDLNLVEYQEKKQTPERWMIIWSDRSTWFAESKDNAKLIAASGGRTDCRNQVEAILRVAPFSYEVGEGLEEAE